MKRLTGILLVLLGLILAAGALVAGLTVVHEAVSPATGGLFWGILALLVGSAALQSFRAGAHLLHAAHAPMTLRTKLIIAAAVIVLEQGWVVWLISGDMNFTYHMNGDVVSKARDIEDRVKKLEDSRPWVSSPR